jgi:cbb3-type cytochrome oxidase maturation protein
MSIAYLLVILGLAAFGGAVWALLWAVDAGQYDDLEAQGASILDEATVLKDRANAPGPR